MTYPKIGKGKMLSYCLRNVRELTRLQTSPSIHFGICCRLLDTGELCIARYHDETISKATKLLSKCQVTLKTMIPSNRKF